MDQDTKIAVLGCAVLGPLALVCLLLIGITAVQFIKREKAAGVPATRGGWEDAGRKAHQVGDAALSSV
jgi:hypothetical protein